MHAAPGYTRLCGGSGLWPPVRRPHGADRSAERSRPAVVALEREQPAPPSNNVEQHYTWVDNGPSAPMRTPHCALPPLPGGSVPTISTAPPMPAPAPARSQSTVPRRRPASSPCPRPPASALHRDTPQPPPSDLISPPGDWAARPATATQWLWLTAPTRRRVVGARRRGCGTTLRVVGGFPQSECSGGSPPLSFTNPPMPCGPHRRVA